MARIISAWVLSVVIGMTALPALGQKQDALEFLKAKQARVEKILKTSKGKTQSNQESTELNEALNELLDYDELSRRSLEGFWDDRKPKERKEFVELLRKLVRRNYERSLTDTLEYRIRYQDARKESDGVVVRTTAKSKAKARAPAVTIEYTMRPVDSGWKIYDITTDGVSLVRNYRSQFGRIIRKHGWNELIRRMHDRLENNATI
ncbi:MAG: ABC transporter substrate-binding protein [Myxococcales bacterium]|nr:ABC transporter substrate-binding protein [Myxococcales bacterium]MCB9708341.1 ABC transporter substrate-binding protein [Myxococcales bacterium]